MIKIFVSITMLLCVPGLSNAQSQQGDVKARHRFSSVNLAGFGSGENGKSAVVQTINGLRKGRWFAGLGLGIDYYANRSVPLFVDLRYELIPKTNALFIYTDVGANHPWLTDNQKNRRGSSTLYRKGLTYEAGIGYKLKGKNDRAFLFSFGYNFKQVKEVVTTNWSWVPGPQIRKEYFDNRFRRVIIKVGLQL